MVDTLETLSAEAKAFYDRKLLERAKPVLKMAMSGQARSIPKNSGNQVSYRRFNQVATHTTALTEGVTPTATNASVTEVTGTVAGYGGYMTVSDQLHLMGIDPVISELTDVMGENAGQSIEEIVRTELVTGTSVLYATGSARNAQSAANPITATLVRKGVRTLMSNDAVGYEAERGDNGQGGVYLGIIHPRAFYDLIGDTTINNTFTYSDPKGIYEYKLPMFAGVAWFVSTKAPVFTGEGSGAADVYGTFIISKNAYGVVDVAGTGKFSTLVKPLGSAGSDDPLDQRASVAWKSFQLPKILNNNFMTRIEAGVTA